MLYQPEIQPIDHIVVTYKDGSTRYVEHAIIGIACDAQIDLSFCNLSKKEIVDFLIGMADIGEEYSLLRRDVACGDGAS